MVIGISFLQNSKYLLIASRDASLIVRSLETCKIEELVDSTHECKLNLQFQPTKYLSPALPSAKIRVISSQEARPMSVISNFGEFRGWSLCKKFKMRIWVQKRMHILDIIDTITSVVVSRDNSKVYSSGLDALIKCWDVKEGSCLFQLASKHEGKWPYN